MIVLFLGFGDNVHRDQCDPSNGEILIASWCLRERLAKSGLFLEAEVSHTVPDWRMWICVAAKRRTIFAMHQLEWSWSLLNGYAVPNSFELCPLPAPDPHHLWQETDETKWRDMYAEWLELWREGGAYRMYEIFQTGGEVTMDERAERWYAESDEFGMLLITQGERSRKRFYLLVLMIF